MNDKKCKNCKHFKRSDKPWQDEFGKWIYGCCLVDHECMYTYPNRLCVYPDEYKPMTKWDKHFGTPEKTAEQVMKVKNNIIDTVCHELGVDAAKRIGRIYEKATEADYLQWLQEECDE